MNSATETVGSSTEAQTPPDPIKYFFREQYAKLGVKGNFMPLAAQPTNVDLGEWLAHQSQSRLSTATAKTSLLTQFAFSRRALSPHLNLCPAHPRS